MLGSYYENDLLVLYPAIITLLVGAAELGAGVSRRWRTSDTSGAYTGALTGGALGLLALLHGFSFSLALSRHDARRTLVLEEANAIGTTANYALMLPEPAKEPILKLLREYIAVRIGFGVPYDPGKLERDIARSLDLQARLWREAVAVSAADPQSFPTHRFITALNEVNNIHERG